MTEVEPSAKPSIPLSSGHSLEDAQEGWAAIRPPALWLDLPEQSDSWADVMRNNWPLDSGDELLSDENESDVAERRRWQQWAKHAAEHERQRRMKVRSGCVHATCLTRVSFFSSWIWQNEMYSIALVVDMQPASSTRFKDAVNLECYLVSNTQILEGMDREEHRERLARREWALSAMDEEQRRRGSQEV